MNTVSPSQITNLKSTREGYGEALAELGETNPNIVVLTADLKESTKVDKFAQKFPERFFDCGVAEQNMTGVAAGMAAAGKIPWISSYAVFSPGRSWDQVRVSVCYSNLPVKIAGCHAGLSVGPDGATHQALEDVAITRVLPNMTVVVPCDAIEAKKATKALTEMKGPGYLRLFREKTPILTDRDLRFEIGKAEIMWDSHNLKSTAAQANMNELNSKKLKNEVAIIGSGPILYQCLKAAEELHNEGIGTLVINNHTIKPLDKETLLAAAEECGAMVTVEEHQIVGGMGSAVAELIVTSCQFSVAVEMVGMRDSFGESGTPEELLEKYGITVKAIKEAAKRAMGRKVRT